MSAIERRSPTRKHVLRARLTLCRRALQRQEAYRANALRTTGGRVDGYFRGLDREIAGTRRRIERIQAELAGM
jgi:ribosomal protein L44E